MVYQYCLVTRGEKLEVLCEPNSQNPLILPDLTTALHTAADHKTRFLEVRRYHGVLPPRQQKRVRKDDWSITTRLAVYDHRKFDLFNGKHLIDRNYEKRFTF